MLNNKFYGAAVITAILTLSLVFNCELPQDPRDPSNTSVSMLLRTSDWVENPQSITDTVGNTIQIGAVINLPENIDSLRMTITANGDTVGDTLFKNFATDTEITLWKKIYFTTDGTKITTVTPYSSLGISPLVAVVNIVARSGPANNKPLIMAEDAVVIGLAQPCSLIVKTSDADTDQTLTVSITPAHPEAVLQGDSLFLWTPPAGFVGYDTVSFTVTDNGKPPLSSSATTIINVTSTPNHSTPLTTPPAGLAAAGVSISSIKVTWNDLTGATTYTIQRSTDAAGLFITVGTPGSASFTDTGLAMGTQYIYHVSASNSGGTTPYTLPVNATTWTKPSITKQPTDQSVTDGTTALFTIVANGNPAPTCQWRKNKVDIPKATSAACTTSAG